MIKCFSILPVSSIEFNGIHYINFNAFYVTKTYIVKGDFNVAASPTSFSLTKAVFHKSAFLRYRSD